MAKKFSGPLTLWLVIVGIAWAMSDSFPVDAAIVVGVACTLIALFVSDKPSNDTAATARLNPENWKNGKMPF